MGLSDPPRQAGAVAYREHAPADASGPPVLLLHAAGATHRSWPEAIRALPGRRVLALDLPGHGDAAPPAAGSIGAMAEAVVALLDALAIPRAVMAGHSMGGAVALALALDAPARVAGLVLVGTGARLRVSRAILDACTDPARAAEVADTVASFSFGGGSPEGREEMAREMAGQAPGVVAADFAACDAFDVVERLGEVRAPTLVVVGSEDRLTPPRYAALLRERLPGEGMLTVPGAGHGVLREAPAEVAAAVEEFLAGLPVERGVLGRLAPPPPDRSAPASPVDVLLVDADGGVGGRVAGLLRRHAHTVVEVPDASRAREAFGAGCRPRALVVDLDGLPGPVMAGMVTLREDPEFRALPLLALSREARGAVTALRPTEVLLKPIEAAELIDAVRRLCGTIRG